MAYVTSAMATETEALSFNFENRDDALIKAVELAEAGVESVSVANVETGEVLTGEDLLAAIKDLAEGAD